MRLDEARQVILDAAPEVKMEQVSIENSRNRILAQDVCSDIDMPPRDKSAMDGYACRREDLEKNLKIIETIPAGYDPQNNVGENECSKIMTGAMIPAGADCVIRIEETEHIDSNTIRFLEGKRTKNNISYRGEDFKTGDKVLSKGTVILPQHIAVLATVGCVNPVVAKRPKVGIIATGSELVEPGENNPGNKIRCSNNYQLYALAAAAGAEPVNYGVAEDTEESLYKKVNMAIEENMVILLSGGSAGGDFDMVPEIMIRSGMDFLVDKIGIKPGKGTRFGKAGNKFCFGLPGNPVCNFIMFMILVRPFLYKMAGHEIKPDNIIMPLGRTVKRKRYARDTIVLVSLEKDGTVMPVEYHGSSIIRSMCRADGYVSVSAGEDEIITGTRVNVVLI